MKDKIKREVLVELASRGFIEPEVENASEEVACELAIQKTTWAIFDDVEEKVLCATDREDTIIWDCFDRLRKKWLKEVIK